MSRREMNKVKENDYLEDIEIIEMDSDDFPDCPEGKLTGYKKAQGYIVALEIPEDAKRVSTSITKCRCNKARVLSIQNIDGSKANIKKVYSDFDNTFAYIVGKIVKVTDFNSDRLNMCASGINFFLNREDAVLYPLVNLSSFKITE